MIDQMKDTIRKASKVVEAPRHRAEEAVRKIAENPDFDLMDAPQLALDPCAGARARLTAPGRSSTTASAAG